jgi:hypothetical protein
VLRGFRVEEPEMESWPRAIRVLMAWRNSMQSGAGGVRAKLRIAGRRPNFRALCRAHSGDIPPLVILRELERRGAVRINAQRTHATLLQGGGQERTTKSVATLRFAAALAATVMREDCVLVRRRQRVPASAATPAPYVEDAISSRVNELLDQMPKMFPGVKGKRRNELSVFALVVREPNSRGRK